MKPGDRVVLVYPPGLEFVVAFTACQYAGENPSTYTVMSVACNITDDFDVMTDERYHSRTRVSTQSPRSEKRFTETEESCGRLWRLVGSHFHAVIFI